jgi:hypothetical protein
MIKVLLNTSGTNFGLGDKTLEWLSWGMGLMLIRGKNK